VARARRGHLPDLAKLYLVDTDLRPHKIGRLPARLMQSRRDWNGRPNYARTVRRYASTICIIGRRGRDQCVNCTSTALSRRERRPGQRHGTRLGAANIGVALVLRRVIVPGAHMWRRVVISPNESRSRLLAALPNADPDLLRPHLEIVDLDVHQVLEEPGDVVSHVYFIESGLVSIAGVTKPHHRIEVGMIGYEGVTGFGVVLGNNRSPNELLVQSAGSALRISTPSLAQDHG
jgi:hypothetical protein